LNSGDPNMDTLLRWSRDLNTHDDTREGTLVRLEAHSDKVRIFDVLPQHADLVGSVR
jgi:hypothetical protein